MQKTGFRFLKLTLVVVQVLAIYTMFAQPKTDTAKNKKPLFTAYLGPYSGGKAIIADLKKLMDLNPVIKVKDAKGTEYKVISFEITWKRKELNDDIRTGKPKTGYYMVGADIKSNQLPENWRTEISSGIRSGEELNVGNILYNDPKKKMNYKAPDILLSIL